MSYVFHRHCHAKLPTIARGEGVYLFDNQGNQYLDACGGAAVSNLGHSHQTVKQAMLDQSKKCLLLILAFLLVKQVSSWLS